MIYYVCFNSGQTVTSSFYLTVRGALMTTIRWGNLFQRILRNWIVIVWPDNYYHYNWRSSAGERPRHQPLRRPAAQPARADSPPRRSSQWPDRSLWKNVVCKTYIRLSNFLHQYVVSLYIYICRGERERERERERGRHVEICALGCNMQVGTHILMSSSLWRGDCFCFADTCIGTIACRLVRVVGPAERPPLLLAGVRRLLKVTKGSHLVNYTNTVFIAIVCLIYFVVLKAFY